MKNDENKELREEGAVQDAPEGQVPQAEFDVLKERERTRRMTSPLRVAAVAVALMAVAGIGAAGGVMLCHTGTDAPAGLESPSGGGGSSAEACDHLWVPQYGSVHHEAVYEDVWRDPVYEKQTTYHTVCNTCQAVIDGKASEHVAETGHSGFSTDVPIENEVVAQEGHYEQVLKKDAWDETVQTGFVCASCGAEKGMEGGGA